MTTWQDISTAPKDGTRILVWTTTEGDEHLTEYLIAGDDPEVPLERVQIAYWDSGRRAWQLEIIGVPKTWMPLPEPPNV